MTNTESTTQSLQVINPFTGAWAEVDIDEIVSRGVACYPWPEEVSKRLDGRYDSDADWLTAAVEMIGEEEAGKIILGS